MTRTTVIIPNYNGMKFLPACIESLRAQEPRDFEVLVVENGSSDGSAEWLRQQTDIRTLFLPENLGFAGGVNAGIRASESDYVLLLNNDTVALPGFVSALEQAIGRSKKLFSVSAMMIKAQDHSLIDNAGDGMTLPGWAYQRGLDEPVSGYLRSRDIFSACGGAAIYRRSALTETGLFDEMHFAYLEDVDLGWRARLAGYYNSYCPSARVYHLGSATSGSKYNAFKVRLSARNNIYLHYKNQPPLQLALNFLPLAAGVLVKGVFFWKKGWLKEYLAGVSEGLRTCGKCRRAPAAKHGFRTYAALEWEFLIGTLEYIKCYSLRRVYNNKS